jgi:hypothetical protein
MNTRYAREYAMFAPAQLLRWSKQRPSNQGDLDSSVTGKVGRVYYTGVDLLLILFLCQSTLLFLNCVLDGTRCTKYFPSFYVVTFSWCPFSFRDTDSVACVRTKYTY